MAGRPKNQKMIEAIKTIPGYNGIPLPSGCPTFLSVLIKTLNQFNSCPSIFMINDKVRNPAILYEAIQSFKTMLNFFSEDNKRMPFFGTDNAKIITGTKKTSMPKRVTKKELSMYFLKHAFIAPDLILKMSLQDIVLLFREIENIHVSRQAVSSNPIYNYLISERSERYRSLKTSDYSKSHRFNKLEAPDETN